MVLIDGRASPFGDKGSPALLRGLLYGAVTGWGLQALGFPAAGGLVFLSVAKLLY
jgi:hypothetical protein